MLCPYRKSESLCSSPARFCPYEKKASSHPCKNSPGSVALRGGSHAARSSLAPTLPPCQDISSSSKLLAWLQSSQKTALALLMEKTAVIRELEVCRCLYELQDECFVATALDPFTGVCLRGLNLHRFHQAVLSFSLGSFPRLESLGLGHCCFLRDDPEDCAGPQPAQQAYREKQEEEAKQSPIQLLWQALEPSGCRLQTLRYPALLCG
ncbi:uncharacterized protein LOC142361889 [Opisthocomus hoazin]|uniref:uncharacterized protein LOC142361889 n=1 Tax=Opisthocomus hoazin TaxID=30419 RepID=UPI003F53AABC